MIYTQLSFDFQRDLHEVSQSGFVDLNDAIITNQIPSDLSTPEESFNDMPVSECIGRPSDVFDGMEYSSAVNSHIAAKQGANVVSPDEGDGV